MQYTGIYAILRKMQRKKVIALMYHGITQQEQAVANFDGKQVYVERFKEQLQYLQKHYNIITLNDFFAWKQGRMLCPKNAVLLTFDDGYLNNYTQLLPLLKKYHVPATIFLPTKYIATKESNKKKKVAWYDVVTYCIATTAKKELAIRGVAYPLTNDKQKISTIAILKEMVTNVKEAQGHSEHEREKLLNEIMNESKVVLSDCNDENVLFLSWEQCREMQQAGVAFGSHSVTHQDMSDLPEKKLREEMRVSKKILQEELGQERPERQKRYERQEGEKIQECVSFAYPFGDYNALVGSEVKAAGYKLGFTVEYGKNTLTTNPYRLKRIAVNNRYELPIFALTLFVNFPKLHHSLISLYSKLLSSKLHKKATFISLL